MPSHRTYRRLATRSAASGAAQRRLQFNITGGLTGSEHLGVRAAECCKIWSTLISRLGC